IPSEKLTEYPRYIKKLVKKKCVLYRGSKRGLITSAHYNRFSKSVSMAIRRFHNSLDRKAVSSGRKGLYRFVNKRMKCNTEIPTLLGPNGSVIKSNSEKADIFATIFQSNFSNIASTNAANVASISNRTDVSMNDIEFDVSKIGKKLEALPMKNSNTPDFLPHFLLKKVGWAIASPVATIFRQSLDDGCLPDLWKQSFVVPIFKKGDKNTPENYRPISLTCLLCRVMEGFICEGLIEHLLEQNLLNDNQFGFLPMRSTSTQLLTCINDWFDSLQNGKFTDCIYIDFAKAFDSVPHTLLMRKLGAYGIHRKILAWIDCFLSHRTFKVKVGCEYSYSGQVRSGVPQGSVLGPVLFLLYINDLPEHLPNAVEVKLYADDVKIYNSYKNCLPEPSHSELQRAYDCIIDWSHTWSLNISLPKCFVLYVGHGNLKKPYVVSDGTTLAETTCVRDLGINIDPALTFATHIRKIVRNAFHRARLMLFSLKSDQLATYVAAYTCYVRPLLEYVPEVWSPHDQRNCMRIEKVQKFFTRISYKRCHLPYAPYLERVKEMSLETLEYRRISCDLCMVYKILRKKTHLPASTFFTFSGRKRAHRFTIYKKRCGNKNQFSWSHRVINAWNLLPREVVEAPSYQSFKMRLTKIPSSLILPNPWVK
ncbi:MAG: reverse transcriptase family protein, partial [Christensenellaceae bacterium]